MEKEQTNHKNLFNPESIVDDLWKGCLQLELIGCKQETESLLEKIVSFSNNRLYAVPYAIAKSIVDKNEFTQLNKIEFTDNKESIKDACVPVIIDRLGNVIEFNGKRL